MTNVVALSPALCVSLESSLLEAVRAMDRVRLGIVLVVDADGALAGIITDGDVRRAVLRGDQIGETSVREHLLFRGQGGLPRPLSAPEGADLQQLREMLRASRVRHIPLVDALGRPVAVAIPDDLGTPPATEARALIMAGGFGSRLGSLTKNTPKPMLRVGGRPLLESIVLQLRDAGVTRITIAVHYLADQITSYFQCGGAHGVEISYLWEDSPLGTAGAVAMLEPFNGPLVVMNGDLVTNMSIRRLLEFHEESGAGLTVAAQPYRHKVPFGVLRIHGGQVAAVEEKPTLTEFVSAGIYVMNEAVRSLAPPNRRFDMPELIRDALHHRHDVIPFPIREEWLDVGRPDDLDQAQASGVPVTGLRYATDRPVADA